MVTFTTDQARGLITKNLNLSEHSSGKQTLDHLDFLEFPEVENNVKADVDFLKKSELVNVSEGSYKLLTTKTETYQAFFLF